MVRFSHPFPKYQTATQPKFGVKASIFWWAISCPRFERTKLKDLHTRCNIGRQEKKPRYIKVQKHCLIIPTVFNHSRSLCSTSQFVLVTPQLLHVEWTGKRNGQNFQQVPLLIFSTTSPLCSRSGNSLPPNFRFSALGSDWETSLPCRPFSDSLPSLLHSVSDLRILARKRFPESGAEFLSEFSELEIKCDRPRPTRIGHEIETCRRR